MRPDDAEQGIRKIIADQVTAWNAGDGAAYASSFAADGSFTNIYGQCLSGHAAFERRHVQILASFFRGTTLTTTLRSLRFIGSHAAVAELDTEVQGARDMPAGAGPDADGVLRTRLLQVFELHEGGWQIVAHHNVAVADVQSPAR